MHPEIDVFWRFGGYILLPFSSRIRVSACHPRKTDGIAALAAPSGSGEVRGGVGEFQGGLGEFLLGGGGVTKCTQYGPKRHAEQFATHIFINIQGPGLTICFSNDFLVGSWSVGTQKQ